LITHPHRLQHDALLCSASASAFLLSVLVLVLVLVQSGALSLVLPCPVLPILPILCPLHQFLLQRRGSCPQSARSLARSLSLTHSLTHAEPFEISSSLRPSIGSSLLKIGSKDPGTNLQRLRLRETNKSPEICLSGGFVFHTAHRPSSLYTACAPSNPHLAVVTRLLVAVGFDFIVL
jgi:hypothetical protein